MLDDRKKAILEAVIKDYVRTAEPVGSRAMVRKHSLGVSPATVRNEMADLEEMGFLEQPHTSAGRIPSEMGFRYYVDHMMVKEQLTIEEEGFLRQVLARKAEDLSNVIQKTGQVLSNLTNYAAVVISPTPNKNEFKHIQLVPIGSGKAMVILVTDVGGVIHKNIDIPESIRKEDLEIVSELFNSQFQGQNLSTVRRTVLSSLRQELLYRRQIIESALEAIDYAMNEEEEAIYVSGALNILNQPEFKDLDKLKKVLVALEEHDVLRNILSENSLKEVRIKIGNENKAEEIKELSIVFTGYGTEGKEMGKIGLIGPVRMEYWRATASVEKVRDMIQDIIGKMLR
ncbi:MAG: heat-inducible transcriptional repressor HrcA [Candidatus Saccharibacteria bacterium]